MDKDLFTMFITNRVKDSKVDFSKESPKIRIETVNTLFKILIGVYGKSFSEQFDSDHVRDLWLNGLLVFTKEEIAGGLELLMKEANPYPPNLIKFIKYCNDAKPNKKLKINNGLPKLRKSTNKNEVTITEKKDI